MTPRRTRIAGAVVVIAMASVELGRLWAWAERSGAGGVLANGRIELALAVVALAAGVAELWWELRHLPGSAANRATVTAAKRST